METLYDLSLGKGLDSLNDSTIEDIRERAADFFRLWTLPYDLVQCNTERAYQILENWSRGK